MSDLVSPDEIEAIVVINRHPVWHYARAVSEQETVYILHSAECKASRPDLRKCPFSRALDRGIDVTVWATAMDRPVRVLVDAGRLVALEES